MEEFVGYHATSQSEAHEILLSGSFERSVGFDNFYGNGVYFFEEDIDAGKWWIDQSPDITTGAILEAKIECPADDILDLTKQKDQDLVIEFLDRVDETFKEWAKEEHNNQIDGKAINLLSKTGPDIKMVRGFVPSDTIYTDQGISNIPRGYLQLTVRDLDCIKSQQIVKQGIS